MLPRSLIGITQRRIERAMASLEKEVLNYERLQNNIHRNNERLRNIGCHPDTFSQQGINLIFTLKDANEEMRTTSQRVLRDIDTITAEIAAYLSLLIEECMENYTSMLKIWLKMRLSRLEDLREYKIQGVSNFLSFPQAVAVLTPYAIKTREINDIQSKNMASIRKLIKNLAELSY